MPLCCNCKQDRSRDSFSKAQWKKKNKDERRCKECASLMDSSHQTPKVAVTAELSADFQGAATPKIPKELLRQSPRDTNDCLVTVDVSCSIGESEMKSPSKNDESAEANTKIGSHGISPDQRPPEQPDVPSAVDSPVTIAVDQAQIALTVHNDHDFVEGKELGKNTCNVEPSILDEDAGCKSDHVAFDIPDSTAAMPESDSLSKGVDNDSKAVNIDAGHHHVDSIEYEEAITSTIKDGRQNEDAEATVPSITDETQNGGGFAVHQESTSVKTEIAGVKKEHADQEDLEDYSNMRQSAMVDDPEIQKKVEPEASAAALAVNDVLEVDTDETLKSSDRTTSDTDNPVVEKVLEASTMELIEETGDKVPESDFNADDNTKGEEPSEQCNRAPAEELMWENLRKSQEREFETNSSAKDDDAAETHTEIGSIGPQTQEQIDVPSKGASLTSTQVTEQGQNALAEENSHDILDATVNSDAGRGQAVENKAFEVEPSILDESMNSTIMTSSNHISQRGGEEPSVIFSIDEMHVGDQQPIMTSNKDESQHEDEKPMTSSGKNESHIGDQEPITTSTTSSTEDEPQIKEKATTPANKDEAHSEAEEAIIPSRKDGPRIKIEEGASNTGRGMETDAHRLNSILDDSINLSSDNNGDEFGYKSDDTGDAGSASTATETEIDILGKGNDVDSNGGDHYPGRNDEEAATPPITDEPQASGESKVRPKSMTEDTMIVGTIEENADREDLEECSNLRQSSMVGHPKMQKQVESEVSAAAMAVNNVPGVDTIAETNKYTGNKQSTTENLVVERVLETSSMDCSQETVGKDPESEAHAGYISQVQEPIPAEVSSREGWEMGKAKALAASVSGKEISENSPGTEPNADRRRLEESLQAAECNEETKADPIVQVAQAKISPSEILRQKIDEILFDDEDRWNNMDHSSASSSAMSTSFVDNSRGSRSRSQGLRERLKSVLDSSSTQDLRQRLMEILREDLFSEDEGTDAVIEIAPILTKSQVTSPTLLQDIHIMRSNAQLLRRTLALTNGSGKRRDKPTAKSTELQTCPRAALRQAKRSRCKEQLRRLEFTLANTRIRQGVQSTIH